MNIKVVGITPVYEKLKSSYVVELKDDLWGVVIN